jgi:hypothetical protein
MNFKMMGPIECTSLVTRIAQRLEILGGNLVPFIVTSQALIDGTYLIQGHILKQGPNDSLTFFSPGYRNEIPLPNSGFQLCNSHLLTIPLVTQEKACHSSVSDRATRSASRRAPM